MLPHQHLALFYEQRGQLWAECAALIQRHVAEGWVWRYVADEHALDAVRAALGEHLADIDGRAVIPSVDLRFQDTPVRVQPILDALRRLIQPVLQEAARPGLLLLVEMTWTIRTPSGAVYLREYEAALHDLLHELPVTLVCLYNQQVMLDRQLLIGLHTHAHLYTPAGLQANPHFLPPRIYASRDERAQFRYWLEQLNSGAGRPAIATSVSPLVTPEPVYSFEAPALLITTRGNQGRWKIRCFGQLHMYRADGTPIDWHVAKGATRKTKALFAFLLYRGEQGASVEELADLLWPKSADIKHSINRLYHVVNGLRHVLSPGLASNRASPFVIHQDQRYFLAVPEHTWVDYPMFQELCYRGAGLLQKGQLEETLLCYQSAERLYTGDFLADIPVEYAESSDEDWCWSRRYWFREMYLKVLYSMASIYRRTGRVAEALIYSDRALRVDSCSDPAVQEKMLALHAAHRHDALDRQYRLYRQALEQFKLGQPSLTVQRLYQSLRGE